MGGVMTPYGATGRYAQNTRISPGGRKSAKTVRFTRYGLGTFSMDPPGPPDPTPLENRPKLPSLQQ